MSGRPNGTECWLCGSTDANVVAEVRCRPEGEPDFGIDPAAYRRRILQCRRCSVYYSAHNLFADDVYGGTYNQSIYRHRLAEKYDRIMGLPADRSDNRQRVGRVADFVAGLGWVPEETRVLDVGTGLCVFLGGVKPLGFRCFAIDPDPIAARHALGHVGVDGAHAGTLADFAGDETFHLVTFNKVLEHVKDPVDQLRRAVERLADDGVVYLELPDAVGAQAHGTVFEREEFFIDHYTMHTPDSLTYLVTSAGLRLSQWECIHEPSDKYTLYAFCRR